MNLSDNKSIDYYTGYCDALRDVRRAANNTTNTMTPKETKRHIIAPLERKERIMWLDLTHSPNKKSRKQTTPRIT